MNINAHLRRILSYTRRAVDDYSMIEDGDKIAVGLSGGKDSMALLCGLAGLRKFYPKKFELVAINLGMGFDEAGFTDKQSAEAETDKMRELCRELDVEFVYIPTQISHIVFNVRKESNPCSLCARMRRGALHDAAKAVGCNKLALGHHFDDAVETFMMNLFNEGRIGCFSPVTYLSRKDITLIRPLVYAPEKDIRYFANHAELPVSSSPCPADRESERSRMKEILRDFEKEYKGLKFRIFGAMQRANVDGFKLAEDLPHSDDTQDALPDKGIDTQP